MKESIKAGVGITVASTSKKSQPDVQSGGASGEKGKKVLTIQRKVE